MIQIYLSLIFDLFRCVLWANYQSWSSKCLLVNYLFI